MISNKTIGALFVVLIIILAINPESVHKLYKNIYGRLFLVSIVVFFSMKNITLGLLVSLGIISALNQFSPLTESFNGYKNINNDNLDTVGSINISIKKRQDTPSTNSNNTDNTDNTADGVDKENIKQTISSKESNSIPVDKETRRSEETDASTEGMLNNSKLDNFSNFASV